MGIAVSLALVAAITFAYRHMLHVNQTTVALSFLLAILAVSAVWGMAVSVVMSLAAVIVLGAMFLSTTHVEHLTGSGFEMGSTVPESAHAGLTYLIVMTVIAGVIMPSP